MGCYLESLHWFCFWMDNGRSLPRGVDGWQRRSANTLLIRILLHTQTGNSGSGISTETSGVPCSDTTCCTVSLIFHSGRITVLVGRSPDNQTALYKTTVPSTWQDEPSNWASLIFHNSRKISRFGTQIKLSRFGFCSTQKLYTSHQNFVIYMRTALALDWPLLVYIACDITRPFPINTFILEVTVQ
jgi:hypothetical protein